MRRGWLEDLDLKCLVGRASGGLPMHAARAVARAVVAHAYRPQRVLEQPLALSRQIAKRIPRWEAEPIQRDHLGVDHQVFVARQFDLLRAEAEHVPSP